MTRPTELSPFSVGLRGNPDMSSDEFEAIINSPQFSLFIDAIPGAVIVTDASDTIVAVNQTANPREDDGASLKNLPLTSYAKLCDLDMDDFLAAVGRGQSRGVVRIKSTGKVFFALRRVILVGPGVSGYSVYFLRNADTADQGKRGSSTRAGGRGQPDLPDNLLFPADIQKWIDRAQMAYQRNIRVLLLGESGVGKTAMAKHLHSIASETSRPFVHVNCGSIPESLFESEMFGYERGAFTGALQSGKKGYIESAAGGTLFLDEIGEIPISSQAKLLKFLEDGSIQPIGSAVSKKIDTRVIGATNRELQKMMAEGTFRRDLYFRIATFPLSIPPLRGRADREAILDQIIQKIGGTRGKAFELTPECRKVVLEYSFPGNLREMRSLIEYLSILVDSTADVSDLPQNIRSQELPSVSGNPSVHELLVADGTLKGLTKAFEDIIIQSSIQKYGSKREAARRLGVDIATLVRKTTRVRG